MHSQTPPPPPLYTKSYTYKTSSQNSYHPFIFHGRSIVKKDQNVMSSCEYLSQITCKKIWMRGLAMKLFAIFRNICQHICHYRIDRSGGELPLVNKGWVSQSYVHPYGVAYAAKLLARLPAARQVPGLNLSPIWLGGYRKKDNSTQ